MMRAGARSSVPSGYRTISASGLVVPTETVREQEVWTRDEWKSLERAIKLLSSRSIGVYLRCEHADCGEAPIARERNPAGEMTWTCAHKARRFSRDV